MPFHLVGHYSTEILICSAKFQSINSYSKLQLRRLKGMYIFTQPLLESKASCKRRVPFVLNSLNY